MDHSHEREIKVMNGIGNWVPRFGVSFVFVAVFLTL